VQKKERDRLLVTKEKEKDTFLNEIGTNGQTDRERERGGDSMTDKKRESVMREGIMNSVVI
jgi:hypothetical protein